ncbi:MAG: NACHT domain-containing protein [Pegethrix bostrychoides GSE-TBD4-15B]|jgi:hypothetical protein|uniref:NACHT domain-containing protein n=1 Tax=Pegethrix bostrychoides GSE-TBD4-15B TaxID=2839662 RepID=A0A951PCM2_9CYAN|nr:NACHT domain-containing protein [Pegethrix bostrychoides GSE-TBD4-15B]
MTGFEPLIAIGTSALTALVTEIVKTKGSKLAEQLDHDILKPKLKEAIRQYVLNYEKRHGELKVACVRMDNPMRLEDLYTAVQVLDRSELRYFESAESLQSLFRQGEQRRLGRGQDGKQSGLMVANQTQYLMVLGGPGVGKSTFLRKVGLEALKGKQGTFDHACIPVFLALQRFNSQEIKVESLIAREFEICGFPESEEFALAALEKGKLLILLDGLDEVPLEHLDHAITQIQDLVDRYSRNRFIASCRVAAYKGGFPRFKDVAMAAFEDEQIEQFIRNWFRAPKDEETQTADQCWELLKRPEYAAAKELAQTPLLLTLLCAVYDESMDFPKNRSTLYGEALDVLLRKWASEKRIQHNPIYQELSLELEHELLADIAFDSFVEDELFFNKRSIADKIREFLVNNLNAPKHLDSEKILEAIEVQQGILVERARDAYSFSHLTFQEYLTAQYIVDNQQIEELVTNHLTDQRWKEVFLLVTGLMPGRKGADELLVLMEKQVRTLLQNPLAAQRIIPLLKWVEQATNGSEGDYKPAAKRSVAVYLALDYALARARDLARARNLDLVLDYARARDLALDLALDLDRVLDRVLDLARALDRDLAFDRALNRARDLDRDRDLDRARFCEQAKIFHSIDFTQVIFKLEALTPPDDNQPPKVRRAFVEQIQKLWFDTLQLDPAIVEFSEEESQLLADYLYANELMVRCKEAAVRLSPELWAGIEARMLTVGGVE